LPELRPFLPNGEWTRKLRSFLDQSCFVAPGVDGVRRFLEAATLDVDAAVSVGDGCAIFGARLARQWPLALGVGEFPPAGDCVFHPLALADFGPRGVVNAHLFQISDANSTQLRVVVGNAAFVVQVRRALEAVRAGQVHRSKNTHALCSIGGSLGEAASSGNALIFSRHSVEKFSESRVVIEAVFT